MLTDQWEFTKTVEGTHGQVHLIRGKNDRKQLAILKIYPKNNSKNYQHELKILQTLKGQYNFIPKLMESSSNNSNSWIITARAPGYSLKDLIETKHHNELEILEAVQLTQRLLDMITNIHSQGVVYGNLKPEHIMINWDIKNSSLKEAQLSLINFSEAYNISNESNPITNFNTDAADICALLFWLITKMDLKNDYDRFQCEQNIENKINREAKTKAIDVKQLTTYLMDTCDVAFDYQMYQPWTMKSLEIRLDTIVRLLTPSDPVLISTEAIFQELISLSSRSAPGLPLNNLNQKDIFTKAAVAFHKAKQFFSESSSNKYEWSNGSCIWPNKTYNTNDERQHNDILTYHVHNRFMSSSYSIIITCLATVHDAGNIITLSIGSSVNDTMIRIPIGSYGKDENYFTDFQTKFSTELTNLLQSICKQLKAVEQ